ncbi:hypothetical protein L0244_38040 [bacterium]|nr:hypothetical protein [bacterium]MCI0618812.1 hypothetical protein [bacterium]
MQRKLPLIFLFLLTATVCLAQEDITAPSFTSLNPISGSVVTDHYVNVTGGTNDSTAVVIVDGLDDLGGFVIDSNPLNFNFLIPVKSGSNTFELETTDPSGNSTTTNLLITYSPSGSIQAEQLIYDLNTLIRWFTPNIKSSDERVLFQNPSQWHSARGWTKVFKFYGIQLRPNCASNICGANKLENFIIDGAFSDLKTWEKAIAFEEPPLPPDNGCNQTPKITDARLSMKKVHENGHEVAYIAMDSPRFYGGGCGLSNNAIADKITSFKNGVKVPGSGGDTTPY